MLNDMDIDMEDLESRLYGQIHHGDREELDPSLESSTGYFNTLNSNSEKRYFTNIPAVPHVFQSYNPFVPAPVVDNNVYSRLGLMFNPAAFNNIVVVQQPPTQIFNNNNDFEARLADRCTKNQRRRKRKRNSRRHPTNFTQRRLDNRYSSDTYKHSQKANSNLNVSGSSCELIDRKVDIVEISSEDEPCGVNDSVEHQISNCKTEPTKILDQIQNDDVLILIDESQITNETDSTKVHNQYEDVDDVIFVETPPNEIINIDCDDETNANECATSPVCIEKNDFLEERIEDNLYVDDLELTNIPDIPKGNLNADASDSETTSTSDSQNRIFKETEFETTGNDISNLSLNDFENYITTSDKLFADMSSTPCSSNMNKSSTKDNGHFMDTVNHDSSDSSSESDYDGDLNTSIPNQIPNKVLPNFSPIVSDEDINIYSFDNTIMEINNGKCKVVQSDKKTSETTTSIICISSSDESSDLEIDVETSIELINIDDPNVFPKQNDPTCSTNSTKPNWITKYWSDDMKTFYNESWNQENFSCEEEQRKMSDDPKMWKIIDKDRTNIFATPKGVRCHRCRQFGHKAVRCPNRSSIPKCILCGTSGHYESKCPNKLCSACGINIPFWTIYCQRCTNFRSLLCKICLLRGHKAANCSDLWRRYHLTVSEGPVVCPKSRSLKLPEDRWCSGCASQGHYEHECDYVIRTYPKTIPIVHSYEDVCVNSNQSQDQNNIQNNRPAQPEIPSLLDLQLDRNEIYAHKDSQPTTLILKDSEGLRLLSHNGVTFLKRISTGTDLQIKIAIHGYGISKTYVCIIDGSECYKSSARNSIKEFCSTSVCVNDLLGLFSKKKMTKNALVNNFAVLQTVLPWTQLVKNTFDKILMLEKQIAVGSLNRLQLQEKKNKCRLCYMALNAVLICKFNAGNQKYLKMLKKWRQSKDNFADVAVQEAYKYVFLNNCRTDIDYKNFIPNLSPRADKSFRLFKTSIDEIMESNMQLCKSFNFHKEITTLENYYRLVVESNYSNRRNLKSFRRFCKKFNKYRNVK